MRMAEAAVANPGIASQTLDAVLREILASLNEARLALEAFVEQSDNLQLLQRCRSELTQVQCVLRVMEIHGAALLAEEMHQVCMYLESTAAASKNQAESLDALMRAIVQLPGYLDRVQAGGRDMALVLLPLLNDLAVIPAAALRALVVLEVVGIAKRILVEEVTVLFTVLFEVVFVVAIFIIHARDANTKLCRKKPVLARARTQPDVGARGTDRFADWCSG